MLLIADTSPIISLLLIERLNVLEQLFPEFLLPQAVWEELQSHHEISIYEDELKRLAPQVRKITYHFPISGIDRGETEAIMLCRELQADYLLIDDKKAREKAELFDIKCIGTLALLFLARQKGLIEELRPLFEQFLEKRRYYAKTYLNLFLRKAGEETL